MKGIQQKDIEYFLNDFEQQSQIELIEAKKEKSELQKIAKRRGIKVEGSRDLAVFKTIYGFTNQPNANGAILPEKELLKVLPQIVGKPISVNHDRRYVVGHYIDYRYIQSSKTIIAYGVFYKSNFNVEWEKAQKLFKKKKLSSSFEIWAPEEAKKWLPNGTFEMYQMEIAGGALIFQDKDHKPAFEGADVLQMAKRVQSSAPELVYSSKHKESEILLSNFWKESVEENEQKLKEKNSLVRNLICQHCEHSFETEEQTNIKCPNCFAILKNDGNVLYPPQVIDFNIKCPECQVANWLILDEKENKAHLKCQSCAKEYEVGFAVPEKNALIDKIQFVYISHASCPQCGQRAPISGTSSMTTHEVTCKKCGLQYSVDTKKLEQKRKISSIVEKSSEERRKEEEMTKEKEEKQEVIEPKVEDTKNEEPKEEVTPEVTTEDKVEEVVEKSSEENKEVPSEDNEETEQPAEEVTPEVDETEQSSEATVVIDETEEVSQESLEEEPTAETEGNELEESSSVETEEKEEVYNETCSDKEIRLRKLLDRAVAKVKKLKDEKKLALETATAKATESKDAEIAKIKEDAEAKIEFAVSNAKLIVSRRLELGEFSDGVEDKDIVNDDTFENLKLKKENAELKAQNESTSEIVSASSERDADFYSQKRDEINSKAFGK